MKPRTNPPLRGRIEVPGDKSISHRALMLAALAAGDSELTGLNVGHDVLATARAIGALGATVGVDAATTHATIRSPGAEGLTEPHDVIDAGNSGTTLRCLLGVAAGVEGVTVLTGDESLRGRPMLRVVAPLRQLGASIDGRDHGDRAPLAVRGGRLRGAEVEISVASAQVKTAVLLAGLRASATTTVISPGPSRDHTERMLRAAGGQVSGDGSSVSVEPGTLRPQRMRVPGDVSSAAFLAVAALLVEGSELTIEGVGLNPTRTALFDVLREMGARLEVQVTGEESGEPVGTIRASHSQLRGTEVDPRVIPFLIDEIPVLAVAASQADGTTSIAGAEELRIKESDRLAALSDSLSSLGAAVQERPDGLVIRGGTVLRGGEVDSAGDHRIALAMAVAGLVASGPLRVLGWGCVETSFPEFLDVLGETQGKGWKRS
ncbi:MAG: 3-phosphoshikimate 1-carboxyvinyltransferase [Actinobacteria bacterium]|nr:3-phosphoshikimate 1-carboxyvinyltransferase [Actinomycetota bacterium]